MATGLIALLDDVAAIAKVAAVSLDDIAAQSIKVGTKSAGVVIDDAAVTPRYVVGFPASRELPLIGRIAWGSVKNKLLYLLPAALLLSLFAPWLITPLLMLGGSYLCYEGAEKVFELIVPHKAHSHEKDIGLKPMNATEMENQRVAGAIRTDFILSAEIMAITLANLPDSTLGMQGIILAIVGIGITLLVYGSVALIVKADDAGMALAGNASESLIASLLRSVGRGLIVGMPVFLKVLAAVGTAAMIWVGGSIILHGMTEFGLHWPEQTIHHLSELVVGAISVMPGLVGWLVFAGCAGVFGLLAGGLLIPLVQFVVAPVWGLLSRALGKK